MSEERESWSSSLGFILAASGSAIGLGNLWRFPYLAAKNGGGAFVIVYLIFVLLLGLTLMIAEFAIGRNGKLDVYGSYIKLKKWLGFAGYLCIISCFIIYSYYAVIAGWIIKYIVDFLNGGVSIPEKANFYGHISSVGLPIAYTALIIIITAFIVIKGVKNGIEKAGKVMIPALSIFLVIITIRILFLPGALDGIKYYLTPDFSKIDANAVLAAMGQVFFSLSLGLGAMLTYGSYLDNKIDIVKESRIVVDLDTIISLIAGLAIIPATIVLGLELTSGPGLLFITLPSLFYMTPLGKIFGTLFFISVLFAALTSTVAQLEVMVAFAMDQFNWKRKNITIIISLLVFTISIFNSLSFGTLADVKIFFGMNFFDFLNYLTDNLLLPIGGVLICIAVGYIWNEKELIEHVTNGGEKKFRLVKIWLFLIRYIVPTILILLILQSLKRFSI